MNHNTVSLTSGHVNKLRFDDSLRDVYKLRSFKKNYTAEYHKISAASFILPLLCYGLCSFSNSWGVGASKL